MRRTVCMRWQFVLASGSLCTFVFLDKPRGVNMIRATMRFAGVSGMVLAAGLWCGPLTAGKKEAPEIPPRKGDSETIKLFNGTNLKGWEGYHDLWSVKDGVIVAKNT